MEILYNAIGGLQKRFELPSRKHRHQAELQIWRKLKRETWADFANDLKFLMDKTYPELQEEARDCIASVKYLSVTIGQPVGSIQMLSREIQRR